MTEGPLLMSRGLQGVNEDEKWYGRRLHLCSQVRELLDSRGLWASALVTIMGVSF